MLPLREARDPSLQRRPATLVWALVFANLLAFGLEQAMALQGDTSFIVAWSFIPRMLTHLDTGHGVVTIFTAMFLHAGWVHLLGNLWFLWFFGRSVEDALGHSRFLALYLAGGVVAALAQTLVDPSSKLPMLGASGAIGAVLAAYVSLFPMRRIVTVVPIIIVPLLIPLPSFVFVLEWFAFNLLRGIGTFHLQHAQGGVAWWAHVGGFLSGLVLVRVLFPRAISVIDENAPHRELGVEVRDPDGNRYPTTTTHSGWD